jgi:hypothetical protein
MFEVVADPQSSSSSSSTMYAWNISSSSTTENQPQNETVSSSSTGSHNDSIMISSTSEELLPLSSTGESNHSSTVGSSTGDVEQPSSSTGNHANETTADILSSSTGMSDQLNTNDSYISSSTNIPLNSTNFEEPPTTTISLRIYASVVGISILITMCSLLCIKIAYALLQYSTNKCQRNYRLV